MVIDVGVVEWGCEFEVGGVEGIVLGEGELDFEFTALKLRPCTQGDRRARRRKSEETREERNGQMGRG